MGKIKTNITAKKLENALIASGGNITRCAQALGIARRTLYYKITETPELAQVIEDSRERMYDECLAVARVLALGIPETDESGKFIGWKEKPDGAMLRYIMGARGKRDGFGEPKEAVLSFEQQRIINKYYKDIEDNKRIDEELKTTEGVERQIRTCKLMLEHFEDQLKEMHEKEEAVRAPEYVSNLLKHISKAFDDIDVTKLTDEQLEKLIGIANEAKEAKTQTQTLSVPHSDDWMSRQ